MALQYNHSRRFPRNAPRVPSLLLQAQPRPVSASGHGPATLHCRAGLLEPCGPGLNEHASGKHTPGDGHAQTGRGKQAAGVSMQGGAQIGW